MVADLTVILNFKQSSRLNIWAVAWIINMEKKNLLKIIYYSEETSCYNLNSERSSRLDEVSVA